MKKTLLVLATSLVSLTLLSQERTVNEGFINYEENSSWIDNSAPSLSPPDLEIDAYVYLVNSITTNNDITILSNDTLYIEGNLNMGNNSILTLNNNAVLVVTGNLTVNNKIDISTNGTIAVQGTFTKQGSANQGEYAGNGKVYASSYGGNSAGYFDNNDASADRTFENLNDDGLTDLYDLITGGGPLPIDLKSFTSTKTGKNINLTWVTAKEENFSHFELERSIDQNEWETIGFVQGVGESKTDVHYDFTDRNAPFGIIYYRLKAVDIDDTFEHSAALKVEIGFEGKLSVSPNPVQNMSKFKIQVPSEFTDKLAYVGLFDLSGTKVQEFRDLDTQGSLQIESQLREGMYILKVNHNGLQENIRVVIQ